MKDKLRKHIRAWIERIDALSVRERVSIFLAAAGGLAAVLVFGIILPSSEEAKRLRQDTAQLRERIGVLQAQLANTPGLVAEAPEGVTELSQYEARLVQPQIITAAVRHLVAAQAGARLLALTLSPAQPLLTSVAVGNARTTPMPGDPEAMPAADQSAAIVPAETSTEGQPAHDEAIPSWYAHGISLQLEGGYAALTQAVRSLERLPWLVEWRSVRLDAKEHPRIRMQVEMAAISKLPAWVNR